MDDKVTSIPALDSLGFAAGQAIQIAAQAVELVAHVRGTHEVGDELRKLLHRALLLHLDVFSIEPKIEAQALIALRGMIDALEDHTGIRKRRPNLRVIDHEANEDDDEGQREEGDG